MTSTRSSHKNSGALEQFRQIWLWELRHNRVLYAVYALLALLCYTAVVITQTYNAYRENFGPGAGWGTETTPEQIRRYFSEQTLTLFNVDSAIILVPLTMLFLAVYCVVTFGYMHRRRSVDLFHALPVRRTPLLLGVMAAGYTIMAAVTAVSMLLCWIPAVAMGVGAPFAFSLLLRKLFLLLLLLAAAMALTVTLLVCSGTVINAVISGILIMGGWPVLCVCAAWVIAQTLPGCTMGTTLRSATLFVPYLAALLPFSGPVTRFLTEGDTAPYSGVEDPLALVSPGIVIWWVCFTAVLLAAAILIYRRRPSEQAENNFSFPPLRVVIQFLVACAVGLAAGVIFGAIYNNNVVFFLAVLIFSAAAHGVTQIIWVRGVGQFKKSLPAYGAAVLAMAAFFVILATGGLGYVNRMPPAERVESVRLTLPGYHYDDSLTTYLGDYCGMDIHAEEPDSEAEENNWNEVYASDVTPKLEEAESVKAVRELHRKLIGLRPGPYLPCHETWYSELGITYQCAGGKTFYRSYKLPQEKMPEELRAEVNATAIDTDTLKSIAKVVALEEYQSCSTTPYLKADQVRNISCTLPRKGGGESGSLDRSTGLTRAQAKKVWDTFRKELGSKDFRYTWEEYSGSEPVYEGAYDGTESAKRAEPVEPTEQPSYSIEMENEWNSKNWPAGMREMLAKNVREPWKKEDEQALVCNANNSTFYVPRSCTQTRKLIKAYTAKVREFYSDEEMDES